MTPAPMPSETRGALARTIRGLRARLLRDLDDALESTYRLSIPRLERADLTRAAAARRTRLEA